MAAALGVLVEAPPATVRTTSQAAAKGAIQGFYCSLSRVTQGGWVVSSGHQTVTLIL